MDYRFESTPITDHLTRIRCAAGECAYLAVGAQRAALIDTGTGVGDLRSFVESLTNRPLEVYITHGHLDHVQGVAQFDRYYVSPKDRFLLPETSMADRLAYIRSMAAPAENPALAGIGAEDLQPSAAEAGCLDLADGETVSLGDYELEFHALPGHTPGSLTVLFPRDRLLLTGDAACGATLLSFPYCESVEQYRENLLLFKDKLAGRYDRILVSHGRRVFEPDLIDCLIETCEDVLRGVNQETPQIGPDGRVAFAAYEMDFLHGRHDGKPGNIVYTHRNIRRA